MKRINVAFGVIIAVAEIVAVAFSVFRGIYISYPAFKGEDVDDLTYKQK